MKFGRKPMRRDPRVKTLSRFTRAISLPPPPTAVDNYSRVTNWGMDMNDTLGDCTIAAVAHCILAWTTAAQSAPVILTDDQVRAAYSQFGGYVPGDDSTDNGCVEQDVLIGWATGGIAGDKLDAFVTLNNFDLDELRDAINWFGVVYLGIQCPRSAQEDSSRWDVVPGSPIDGGHAIMLAGYDQDQFYAVSWGRLIPTTPQFLTTYVEEAYAPISRDFITAAGTTPQGLNIDQMIADSKLIRF